MKDNKKKMLVMALLGLAVVGVGAFQFMGSGPAPASVAKKKAPIAAETTDPKAPKNPEVAMALPERDPFAVPASAQPTPMPTPTPTPTPPQPTRHPTRIPGGYGPNTGEVPPLPPMGGDPRSLGNGQIGGPNNAAPGLHIEPTFGYQVSGVIVGEHPAAVFVDAQGNQRLVRLGGSIDSETTVTGIEKGKVSVRFRGKTLHFDMGGNPNAK